MIVEKRVELEEATMAFFENGAVQLSRDNGTTEYLNAEEAETISNNV